MWKRWLIVILCVGLVVARLIWPHIEVDAITIWLVAIAAIFFVMPELRIIFPYIKRIRLGEAEIELKEEVKELGKEVERVQESVIDRPGLEVSKDISPEINEILRESGKDPRAALLLLSAKIEREVNKRLLEAGLNENKRYIPTLQAIQRGVDAGLFPQETRTAIRDFWNIRNKVAHGRAFDVEDSTIFSLISLGTELLKIISTEKSSDT